MFAQLGAQGGVMGAGFGHGGPKAGAVVHHAQVGQLVHHHIVQHIHAAVQQPPVQHDAAIALGAAPARARVGQAQAAPLHAQLGRKVAQPLGKQIARVAQPPGGHGSAHLGGAGVLRHGQVQRPSPFPYRQQAAAARGGGVQVQGELAAQKWQHGAMHPADALGLRLVGALALLLQFLCDPARFFMDGFFQLRQRDPARRADGQALRPHLKADAAARSALEPIGHACAVWQQDLVRGFGVLKILAAPQQRLAMVLRGRFCYQSQSYSSAWGALYRAIGHAVHACATSYPVCQPQSGWVPGAGKGAGAAG